MPSFGAVRMLVRSWRLRRAASPWRAPHRLDVAYARLQQTEIAEAMAVWWLDRLTRLVQAGVSGFRCLDPDHAPASLWRRIIGALKQNMNSAISLPGRLGSSAPCCRDWGNRLRPCVFVARVVGWARGLAGRGDRAAAAHRAGDRLAGALFLRAACGSGAAWRRRSPLPVALRCGWPPPPRTACSCPWASSTPRAVRSTPRWAHPEDLASRPRRGAVRPDGRRRRRQCAGRSHRSL